MLVGVLVAWAIIVVCLAVAWGLFHAHVRRLDGIDEDEYIDE